MERRVARRSNDSKPRATETQLVRTILDGLMALGIFAWRANSGAVTAEYKGKKRFVRFSGVDGLSDIIGVLPGGRFLAIECKVGNNKPTQTQAEFMSRVVKAGGVAVVARSWEDVQGWIALLTHSTPKSS